MYKEFIKNLFHSKLGQVRQPAHAGKSLALGPGFRFLDERLDRSRPAGGNFPASAALPVPCPAVWAASGRRDAPFL